MPSSSFTTKGEVLEGNDWFLTYRLVRADGDLVSRSDITSTGTDEIGTVKIYSLDSSGAASDEPANTVSIQAADVAQHIVISSATSAPLTDGFWNGVDSTGYNFFYRVPYGTWMKGGVRYRVEFSLVLEVTSGSGPGTVSLGTMRWASLVTVKSMVSI